MNETSEQLEPAAATVVSIEAKYMVSTAISLKRIADALEMITDINSETLGKFIVETVKQAKPEIEKL
jgi:hypothetical protein